MTCLLVRAAGERSQAAVDSQALEQLLALATSLKLLKRHARLCMRPQFQRERQVLRPNLRGVESLVQRTLERKKPRLVVDLRLASRIPEVCQLQLSDCHVISPLRARNSRLTVGIRDTRL